MGKGNACAWYTYMQEGRHRSPPSSYMEGIPADAAGRKARREGRKNTPVMILAGRKEKPRRRAERQMQKKLNARQEKYCEGRAAGLSRSKAYKAAGYSPNGSTVTAEQSAHRLDTESAAASTVRLRIEELRRRAAETAILSRDDRLRLLSELATDEAVKPQDRLRATDQLSRMCGDYNDSLRIEGQAAVMLSYADRIEAIRQSMEEGQ